MSPSANNVFLSQDVEDILIYIATGHCSCNPYASSCVLTKAAQAEGLNAIAMNAVDRVMAPMAPVFALMQLWAQSHSINFTYMYFRGS